MGKMGKGKSRKKQRISEKELHPKRIQLIIVQVILFILLLPVFIKLVTFQLDMTKFMIDYYSQTEEIQTE